MDDSKKYGLFAGEKYYPTGGAEDFQRFGSSIDELKEFYNENLTQYCGWGDIVEMETMTIICRKTSKTEWKETKK